MLRSVPTGFCSNPSLVGYNYLEKFLVFYNSGVITRLTVVLRLEQLVAEVVVLDITSDSSEVLDTVSGGSGDIW